MGEHAAAAADTGIVEEEMDLVGAVTLGDLVAKFLDLRRVGHVGEMRRDAQALRQPRGLALGAVLAPFAALASFAVYLQLTLHDAFAWTHAERAWGRKFTPLGLYRAIERLPIAFDGNAWVVRDVVFFVLYLALLWIAWRAGVPQAWIAAALPIVVLPTFSGSFHSVGRFGLLAPALFWGLAAAGEHLRVDRGIRILSAALLVGGTVSLAYVFP